MDSQHQVRQVFLELVDIAKLAHPLSARHRARRRILGLEIGTGTEGLALAGEDHYPHLAVVIEFAENAGQLAHQFLTEGVVAIGTVEAQFEYALFQRLLFYSRHCRSSR